MAECACPAAQAAKAFPGAVAFATEDAQITYDALDERVTATAQRLAAVGIARGDVIALGVNDGVSFAVLVLALARRGALALPLNSRLPRGVVDEILRRAGCHVYVTEEQVHADTPCDAVMLSASDLVSGAADVCGEARRVEPNKPAVLVLTSGSSGPPKMAALSLSNLYENALRSNRNIALAPGDRWLLSLPLYHVSGLGVMFRCLAAGATVACPRERSDLAGSILRQHVTHVSLVPTQLYRLLQTGEGHRALGRLRAILLGGSAVSRPLIEEAHAAGLPLFTTYGMTEMGSQITTTKPGDTVAHRLTSGRPLAADTVRVNDDGEIEVRGETLFLGYFEQGKTRLIVDDAGWFRTGDLGSFDVDGYLIVHGRRDNMFIVGGENVQPEVIERCLVHYPGVAQARVVPVADAEYGCLPVAFVEVRAGASATPEALRDHLAAHLPSFAVPRHYLPWPPPGPDGGIKPRKQDLVALATQHMQALRIASRKE